MGYVRVLTLVFQTSCTARKPNTVRSAEPPVELKARNVILRVVGSVVVPDSRPEVGLRVMPLGRIPVRMPKVHEPPVWSLANRVKEYGLSVGIREIQ